MVKLWHNERDSAFALNLCLRHRRFFYDIISLMPDTTGSSKKIMPLLFKKYPDPKIALHFSNPFELLIATILSAQCPDTRVNNVTEKLFRQYRTAEQFAALDSEKLEGEIFNINYYRSKAKAIIGCCKQLIRDYHSQVPHTMEELVTLPGTGRKTANVILGCAFGKPVIIVDTHVLRVANRLALAHSNIPVKVEQELMLQIPKDKWTSFSLALILHGRETCTARQPACGSCVLYSVCKWPEKDLNRHKTDATA